MWLNHRSIIQCVTLAYILTCLPVARCETSSSRSSRQKRLAYPTNSCTGILVAVAIPLGLENRNVFVSWNYEANYNMPTTAQTLIPGPLTRLELVDRRRSMGDITEKLKTKRDTVADPVSEVNLISRAKIYQFLIKKLSSLNLDGRACLLRSICETVRDPVKEHNGIIGDLLSIILTPSSTSPERELSGKYFEAEKMGRMGDCRMFSEACNVNILDMFSNVL